MKLFRIFTLIILIGVVSCETEELTDTVVQDSAVDNSEIISTVNLEIDIEEIDAIFDDISFFTPITDFVNGKISIPELSKNVSTDDEEEDRADYFGNCVDFEFTRTDNTITFTLTLNGECEDRDGNPITGIITRTVTYSENSFEGTTVIDNLSLNGYVINGTRSFVWTENNDNGNREVSSSVDITFENEEGTISKAGERTVELTEGGDTATREDDVRTVTGFFEYMTPERSFSMEITTPLVKPATCRYIVSGVKTYTTAEGTSTLDYGDGSCDNLALLTLPDGSQEEITLRGRGDFNDDNGEEGEDEEEGDGEDGDEDDQDGTDGEDGDEDGDDEDGDEDGDDGTDGQDGDDSDEDSIDGVARLTEILTDGQWKVGRFIERTGTGRDDFNDLSSDFQNYRFDFEDNGIVIVSENGNDVASNPWEIIEEDRGLFLSLDFANAASTLSSLTNEWPMVSASEDEVIFVIGELDIINGTDNRIFLALERQ